MRVVLCGFGRMDTKDACVCVAGYRKVMYPEEPANVSFVGTFYVDTRDGEKLATDVYLPVKEGEKAGRKIPAVLVRTPYVMMWICRV